MPIRKEMRALYPTNWREIRARIQARAGDRCEWCGVENGSMRGDPVVRKPVKIVCTTAHLNHNVEDNRDENLAFLCQKCHNGHDAKMRAAGRKARALDLPGQTALFEADIASTDKDGA